MDRPSSHLPPPGELDQGSRSRETHFQTPMPHAPSYVHMYVKPVESRTGSLSSVLIRLASPTKARERPTQTSSFPRAGASITRVFYMEAVIPFGFSLPAAPGASRPSQPQTTAFRPSAPRSSRHAFHTPQQKMFLTVYASKFERSYKKSRPRLDVRFSHLKMDRGDRSRLARDHSQHLAENRSSKTSWHW